MRSRVIQVRQRRGWMMCGRKVVVGVELTEKAAVALREISAGAAATLDKTRDVARRAGAESGEQQHCRQYRAHIAQMVDESDQAVRSAVERVTPAR